MAPEAAEAALRAPYAEESNRLNRERRAGMERDRANAPKWTVRSRKSSISWRRECR